MMGAPYNELFPVGQFFTKFKCLYNLIPFIINEDKHGCKKSSRTVILMASVLLEKQNGFI